MANEFRVRKKLIVNGSGSTILDVQGSQGQLFSVTDSLSGSLFSVKDISGIPVIEAFSDDTVNIGTFNAEAIKVSGSFARITGSLLGTASWANNAVTSSFAQTASYVSSTSIVGSLTQIATGSVSASVNTDISASFRITSGSNTLLNVTRDGFVWIGNGSFTNQGYRLDVQGTSYFNDNITVRTDKTIGNTFTNIYFGTSGVFNNRWSFTTGNSTFGVHIGTVYNLNNTKAILELTSTNQGFLAPRMTAAQRTAISSPAQGLIVYDTGSITEGLWFYNSGSNPGWQEVLTNSGSQSISGSLTVTQGITGSILGTSSFSQFALTASYALNGTGGGGTVSAFPYTGSAAITGSISLTGSIYVTQSSISTVDWIDFTVDPGTPPHSEGRIHWDVDRKTLQIDTDTNNFTISAGHVGVLRGRNTNPFTLTKGTVVYINGNSGQFATFATASWTDEVNSAYAIGIVAQDINTNNYGYAVTNGEITGINTNAFAPAALLYLSSSGQYTDVKPEAPIHTVRLGQVVVSSTSGILQVKVDNGYETDELHDVLLNNTSSGDLFVKSGSLWTNSKQLTGSYGLTGSINITGSLRLSTPAYNTSSINVLTYNTASSTVEYSTINDLTFTKNIVNVGLSGSRGVRFNTIKSAVASITDASQNNTYTVRVAPGIYIEDTITVPSWVAIKGDSSISTVVSASNPSASIFVMSDQSMVIDLQIQGSTGPSASAIFYSSPTTPQTNAIAYAENIRFGTNYTNATCAGSGSGNCILQCSNVKYGGFTDASLKSFDIGFRVTGSGGSIGRMQLRNATSTNGGVAGTDNNQIFALADAPGCTFIVNGCLLTRATGTARGTAFKVYNGASLRLTAVNFQRWINGIWAPQTGSAPSIDAIALNFENCTTDVLIEHTGSTGKVQGTDNFLKTQIALTAPLYEVGQDPRKITVGTKGADFTSISASVAWISGSNENNRYVIEVGPGQFTENMIDLTGKPYVSIVGSNIQTTQIFPSSSTQHIIKMGVNNELSFLSLANAGPGYSAIYVDDVGDFAQVHKISIYDSDRGITVLGNSTDTQFYGEYVDINGTFSYGAYISSSNGTVVSANIENYYLFPSASATIGNYVAGPSASLSLYTSKFLGDATANSTAVKLEDGSQLEAAAVDIQDWDYGYVIPNTGVGPNFRVVGAMIHNSVTYDFDIQNATTRGRYQGVSDHTKISNTSQDFYWNFLDDEDGENDVTRKLSVTFADGTHTDATTLIFKGSPMGVMQGGEITISGSLTINTAAGFGYLQDSISTDVYKRIDWVNSTLALSPNTNNYIYLNDNEILSASGTAPDSETNIILGRVVTNATGIEFIDQSPYNGEHMSNKLSKFNREALGPVFAEGSIVTEDATPFKLDVTQGSYFFSENNFLPAGTSSINLTQYYQSASVWARYTSSVIPNNVYASGSALVAMSASYYTKHTVYLVGDGADEEYFLVINDNQYSSLVATENASLPTIPTYFNDGVVPLAAVYVQSGSANITQIQDIRPIIGFRAAGVNASSVHGNLLGLTADDHLQYLRVDGFREMTGDFGLGGNDLYNVSSVSASAITSSGASITDIKATSITGSLFGNATSATSATTASYALTASSAESFLVRNSLTASSALINGTITAQTLIVQTVTSSTDFVTGSTRFGSQLVNTHQFTGSVSITGSLSVNNSSVILTNQTGSMSVASASFASTASYVLNSVSSSFAQTASYVLNAVSSSFAQTASYVLNAVSSSFSTNSATASYVLNAVSASFAQTASYVLNAVSSSFATRTLTASYAFNAVSSSFATNTFTASYILNAVSASNASTASYVLNAVSSSFATNAVTASYILNAISSSFSSTASYVLNAVSSSFATQAFTASYVLNAVSASNASTASYVLNAVSSSFAQTASYVLNSVSSSFAQTASYVLNAISSSFATSALTASFVNRLNQSVVITNALAIGTSSFGSTENTLVVGLPQAGGSGEGGQILLQASGGLYTSASMLDNYQNRFRILRGTNASSDAEQFSLNLHTGQLVINRYTGSGAFPGTAAATLAVDSSGNVITITGTGGSTTPGGSNTQIQYNNSNAFAGVPTLTYDGTTLRATGSFTGSFVGELTGTSSFSQNSSTASYALNAVSSSFATNAFTASYVLNAVSSSFAQTASYVLNAISSSFATQASTASYVLNAISSSFATNANTASYVLNAVSASNASTASYVLNAVSSSFATNALTASYVLNAVSSSFATTALTASYGVNFTASNLLVTNTITAQTLVVQTVTSSTEFVTGSTRFGSLQTNTHQFTGSVTVTGSLSVVGQTTINNLTGSLFGTASWAQNAVTSSYILNAVSSSYANRADFINGYDGAVLIFTGSQATTQRISGSLQITGSLVVTGSINAPSVTGSLFGTSSWSQNAVTASYVTGSIFTSANPALSASYALTASYALNGGGTGGGGLKTKSGAQSNASFTGNPKKSTVTFATPFVDNAYAVTVTGDDARSWTIESKVSGSFVINANSNTGLGGSTYWIAIAFGES
jgi:hypothetical protein